ncbi:hypothetical protein HAX54_013707, partial [Datura stramonium]|nr:hypothetical protein [Datura stramonium]
MLSYWLTRDRYSGGEPLQGDRHDGRRPVVIERRIKHGSATAGLHSGFDATVDGR